MKFSFWPQPTQNFEVVSTLASHVENTGWDGLWLADHFMPNAEDTSAPWPEAWTTLGALAVTTSKIRLGTLVTGNTYRHPAVLAKMAATIDHISGGRCVLGLGSGWQENEHEKYGIPFHTIKNRLERLEEACQVIKALFTEPSATIDGRFYQLKEAPLEPKPVQSPLPLLIGGGGEKVTLRIAAQYADEWNVWGKVSELKHKMTILDQHCEKLGRDPKEIHRTAVAMVFLTEDDAFAKKMNDSTERPPRIAGNINQLQDIIGSYKEIGVDEFIVPDFSMGNGAGEDKLNLLNTFIEEIAPTGR